jgi:uncharacterized phage protein (TIGR02218 family)
VSRTLSASLSGHLSTRSHSRCNMLLIVLRDGTEIGITDHDKDLTFDVGDGELTYSSGTGILTSNVSLSCGLDADNYEVSGPVTGDDPYTVEAFTGGRWDRARAKLFQVNWKNLPAGAIRLVAGNVSEARIEGGKFVLEVRSDMDAFNQVVGRIIANNCDADFGDARCGATPTSVVGTVTVGGSLNIAVSYTGSHANDFFNLGTIVGLTGPNTGVTREIFDWSEAGAIELFSPLPSDCEVGDTFTVKRGCGKTRTDCMDRLNIVNFRGYPEVPGRKALMPAIPGQGNEDDEG